jgi:cytochrome P450
VIFGKHDVDDGTVERLHAATRTILKGFPLEAVTPFSIPHTILSLFSSRDGAIEQSERYIQRFAEELLKEEERNPSDPPNALTAMVEGMRVSTPLFNRDTVLNNIRVLLIAGHETSGNVLAYAIANLALRGDCAASVVAEAATSEWRSASSLTELREALPYTRQVIEESLRLHPPFYVLLRRTTSDVTVECSTGKFWIPKGTELTLDIFNSQRDNNQWGTERTGYAANRFAPERWGKENVAARGLSNQALDLFSFGSGPRICLGLHLFWSEALPAIARCMDEFTFTPRFTDADAGMSGDLSLQREGGYPVTVTLRKGSMRSSS